MMKTKKRKASCKSMILMKIRIGFLFVIMMFAHISYAQLSKPNIGVSEISWGWFTLTMTGYSQIPSNTAWLILEGADTVLNPRWNSCDGYFPFIADRCDLFSKHILGCKPNTTYTAKVSYNNGVEWSAYSDPVAFTTLAEPQILGNDTIFIVLWGHSLIHLGDLCSMKTTIRLGNEYLFVRDNMAHMLQTELKRITNKNIKVINKGQFGSMQYRWLRDDSLYKAYLPGGEFENTQKYRYAMFFFGSNDCNANYPSPAYGDDIRWILNFLISKNVKVMFNSIHHTTNPAYTNQDSQVVYRNVWSAVMNEYSGNELVKRGLDLYELFQDSVRYIWNDGIHCNLSEGMPQLVRILAPEVQSLVGLKETTEFLPEKCYLYQNYPNPFNSSTRIVFDISLGNTGKLISARDNFVTLTLYDVSGRKICIILKDNLKPGTYSVSFDGKDLPSGVYFCVLKSGETKSTRKIVLLK